MEHTFTNAQKDGHDREDSMHSMSKGRDLSVETESKSERLVRRVNSHHGLILKVKQFQRSKRCIKDSFLQSIRALDSWIPKPMVTVEEKYLRRCLELIHISASKSGPCNISLNWGLGNVSILSDGLNPAKIGGELTCELARLDLGCQLAAGAGSVVISPAGQWIVGSIMGSKSMVNILKSPLLHQYSAFDGDANFQEASFNDVKGSIRCDFMNSPSGLTNYSSHKLYKESPIQENYKYGPETLNERLVSISNTNSTCSDQSSSSPSATIIQGMLQCTWKGGYPHFVFSLDDQNVVYVASLWRVESANDKALDHTYLFHSRTAGQKGHDIHDSASRLVGKMKVSTSFTICPNNSRIMEREFVLFGANERIVGDMHAASHDLRKSKGLSKKVAEVFRTTHLMKKRSTSRFGGSSAILENCSWESVQDTDNNIDVLLGTNLLENHLPSNLELAAIVVKDHFPEGCQEKVGGWGLKFLKKVGVKHKTNIIKSSVSATCSAQDSGDCSTSMDILLPAGLHGGPMTRNGGPSSLIDRWRSGGCCDCGGWDLGCPLTVLKSRSSKREPSFQADIQGDCKLIILSLLGSEKNASPLRMVNVHDGLYFVHFQPTLSALQSFSIAVAFIHSQSPALRPKNIQELQ